jgi:hypothetical protein
MASPLGTVMVMTADGDEMGAEPPEQTDLEPENGKSKGVTLSALVESGATKYDERESEALREVVGLIQAQVASALSPLVKVAAANVTRSFMAQVPILEPLKLIPGFDPTQLLPRFESVIAPVIRDIFEEQNQRLAAQIRQLMPDFSALFQPLLSDFAEYFEQMRIRHMPPNWPPRTDFREAVEFVAQTGWAIVWLPSEAVVAGRLARCSSRPAGAGARDTREGDRE